MLTGKRDFLKIVGAGFLGALGSQSVFPKREVLTNTRFSEDVAERVIQRGVLRAAYIVYPPYFMKDPNTKAFSGLYYDMAMKLAADLDVKIVWVEEVSFANPFEGFYSDRYDIVAANIWPNGSRMKRADFTSPVCYNGFNVFIRSGQKGRFKNLSALNQDDVRFTLVDGEGFVPIAQSLCPKAHFIFLPNNVSNAELVLQLLTNKADATFLELAFANDFLRQRPKAIEPLTSDPIQVFPCGFSFARQQYGLRSLLDRVVENMVNSGFVENLLKKYETTSGDFIRVAKPYQGFVLP